MHARISHHCEAASRNDATDVDCVVDVGKQFALSNEHKLPAHDDAIRFVTANLNCGFH